MPLDEHTISLLRPTVDDSVDVAGLRAALSRLLHAGVDRAALAEQLESLGAERRAMNDEAGEELILEQIGCLDLDGQCAPSMRLPDVLAAGEAAAGPAVPLAEAGGFEPPPDRRPMAWNPPPVQLVSVDDVRLPAPAGSEDRLDDFYLALLQFQRDNGRPGVVYRAENFRLIFEQVEGPIARDGMRAVGIVVRSLAGVRGLLHERQIEYVRQRGLTAGQETLSLQDPAGNWLELTETRGV